MSAAQALLHPGFHKTGTSSAQHFLAKNRAALAPHLQIVLLGALKPADKTARRFSKARDAASLVEFAAAFAGCLTRLDPDPTRPLLLSCEGLSGDIPGRAGIADYSAAVDLVPIAWEVLQRHGFARPTLHFSLRDPRDWLYSAWRHNIAATRLDMDFDAYARAFGASADLDGIVARVAAACPGAPVGISRLEDTRNARFGPATPLIAPFDLPEAVLGTLKPAGVVNRALPERLIAPLRALNRGALTGAALKAAKARLIEADAGLAEAGQ